MGDIIEIEREILKLFCGDAIDCTSEAQYQLHEILKQALSRKELVEEVEGMKKELIGHDKKRLAIAGYNSALSNIITLIKGEK